MKSLFRRLLTPLWLRPERALWDAHELHAVHRMLGTQFERPALEYGCTEGVNTFVMLGGEFALAYDDYEDLIQDGQPSGGRIVGPGTDYFSLVRPTLTATIDKPAEARFDVGVSWREAHLEKSRRLDIYDELHLIELNTALTPLRHRKFRTIWSPNLYWSEPEHLRQILAWHVEVLDQGGRLLTIVPDQAQVAAELWSKLSFLPEDWRQAVDRNIGQNLTKNARPDADWQRLFSDCGLKATNRVSFLPRLVGGVYQVGLRPMFPVFLQMYSMLKACPPEDFLDVKRHWIDTAYHFMSPLADPTWQQNDTSSALWYLYELRHAA